MVISLCAQPRVKFDLPPGGFPLYLTEVLAPAAGCSCAYAWAGVSSYFYSSCFYIVGAAAWFGFPEFPNLSSSPP